MIVGDGHARWLIQIMVAAALLAFVLGGAPRSLLIALAGSGVALSFLTGSFALRRSRSLRILVDRASRIADGDLSPQPHEAGPGGISSLSAALERLTTQLVAQQGRISSQRELLEAVLTGMEEAILVVRTDNRLFLANQTAKRLLDLPRDAEDQALVDVVRAPALLDAVRQASAGKASRIELALGKLPPRELIGRAAPLPEGGAAAVVVVLRDVTELRKLEAMRSNFVSNASHELRTPVAAIRGYAETLASGALDDPEAARRFVTGLSRQAQRLSLLIDSLLDLSRIESGGLQLSPTSIDVRATLQRLVDSSGERAAAKGLRLAIVEGQPLPDALADPKALELIFGNLLENAIKYTPGGGSIEIAARRESDGVRIEVRDTGPGIEPQHQARIFERFYRVDAGRARDVGGSGLGLAIAKHLAQRSGGDIGVSSRPGAGSCFWVQLPSAPSP